MMIKGLEKKVALVTGGARGIGAAIARELAEDGADVAISYAGSAERAAEVVRDIQKAGVQGEAYKADQGRSDEVWPWLTRYMHDSVLSTSSS